MAVLLRQAGLEPEPFEGRLLSEQMLKDANLILTMTRAHRGLVVELWPAAVRRAFTLREFARLLSRVDRSALPDRKPGDRLGAAIPLASAERGNERTSPGVDDVLDPFRLSDEIYAESFAQMLSAVDAIADVIVMNRA
jgi:protein-tyrosine phosphatase